MANHHTNAARLDSEGLTRRNLLMALPVAGAALALPAMAKSGEALLGDIIEQPFLHVLDGPIPGYHSALSAGDMVLVLPGAPLWDDMHLLRDGRFAAVQVFRPDGLVGFNIYGSSDHFYVPKDRAPELIAGRVAKRIRLDRGRWMD